MNLDKDFIQQAEEDVRQAEEDIRRFQTQTFIAWHKKIIVWLEIYLLKADIRRVKTCLQQAEGYIRPFQFCIIGFQTYIPLMMNKIWTKEDIQRKIEEIQRKIREIQRKIREIQRKIREIQNMICDVKEIESDDYFRWNEDKYEWEVYSQGQWKVAHIGQPSVYDSNKDQRSCSWQWRLYRVVKKNGPEQRQPFLSFDTNANQRSFAWRRRFNKVKKIYVDRERCFVYTDSIGNPRSCAWRRRIYMIMEGTHVDDYNTQLFWLPMMFRWSSSMKRTKKKHLSDTCVASEWPDKWKRRPNIHLPLKFVKAGGFESENVRVITTLDNYLVSVLSFCVNATGDDLQKILGSHRTKFSNHKKRKGKSLGSKMMKIIPIEAAPPDKQFR